ncbi:hypothetical protein AGMMS49990_04590 [Endomicrobiia bacterium]|nr:hypothetical protein AGMMS49990_04590 [Endomicrobiia bacterium]
MAGAVGGAGGHAGDRDSVVDGFFFGDGEGVIINTDDESFGTVISDGESGVGADDGVVAGDAT